MPTALLIFFALLGFLFSSPASARWDLRLENYVSGKYFDLGANGTDPTNRLLNRPSYQGFLDVRPEVKFTSPLYHKLILRPRFTYVYDSILYKDTNETYTPSTSKADLSDAYWEAIWNDEVRTTVGLQVYQWGPAEFINASNPIFHLNTQQRSTIFKEKGQPLLRMNVDYSRNWNQVFILQPISNAERPWIDEVPFSPKSLIKTEWISDSSVNSIGFVFGKEERGMGFMGEYFSFSPVEGFSLYADSKHTEHSVAFYPDTNPYGTESLYFDPITRGGWTSLGVAGVRKEWAHLDLRLEYIYNSGGWTSQQLKDAIATMVYQNPETSRNRTRFSNPGLELLGRGYGYISARFFNIGKKDNHSISFRYLQAEQDGSSTLMVTYDWDFSDSINLFAEYFGTYGDDNTELNLLQQQTYLLGFRWSL
jgi:hypothetical protein